MYNFNPIREQKFVSKEQFFNEIVPLQKPVVLRGIVGNWPCVCAAMESSSSIISYLNNFYRGKLLRVFTGDPCIKGRLFYSDDMRGFNFSSSNESLNEVFDRIMDNASNPEPPMVSIQGIPVTDFLPGFTESNSLNLFDLDINPNIWIGNKVIVSAHYDSSDNLACVISGRRRFVLFPPEQTSNIYPGPLDFTPAGTPVSLVSLHDPDFERYPRYKEALMHAQVAELEPGDAIFIPMLWWHHVDSIGSLNILVNYWWNGAIANPFSKPTPLESLGLAILAMKSLSPSQKDAWRAMYDHYLFKKGVDPVEYIPPHRLGILGELSPDFEKQIKKWFIEQLGKE